MWEAVSKNRSADPKASLRACDLPVFYCEPPTLFNALYIRNNQKFIPNFGERYRQGDTISTAFVESTINQVVSKRFVKCQQMQWTQKGTHLLLQTRVKVLDGDLEEVFRGWYPQFRSAPVASPIP